MARSNVFNLAALLGLAAVVAGRVGFHRRVVLLGGVPGVWVAVVCLPSARRSCGASLADGVTLPGTVTVLPVRQP